MTSYIDKMFKHMNLQAVCNLLIYGTDECEPDNLPYSVKLKNGSDPIYKRIENLYPKGKERDEALSDLSKALSAYEAVYLELGMKAGARLICQLLISDAPQTIENKNQ